MVAAYLTCLLEQVRVPFREAIAVTREVRIDIMKRLLLVLPFVIAACDGGSTAPTSPAMARVNAGAISLSTLANHTCAINGITFPLGFNEFGYNYCARIFNGPADGVDKVLDGMVWGDPTYANDHLIMKWNAAWDACNAAPTTENCTGAWTDNEWNGKVPNGSGQNWHYKIVWSAICAAAGTLTDGGYCVWGSYEVLMDQGSDPNAGPGHLWFAHAKPNGYGS